MLSTGAEPGAAYNCGVRSFPLVVLYRRTGCHLCDDARTALDAILDARGAAGLGGVEVVERDIDADDDLRRRLTSSIPVIEIGDRTLELAISPGKLRRFVDEALSADPPAAGPHLTS
jgi:hypothetical protein